MSQTQYDPNCRCTPDEGKGGNDINSLLCPVHGVWHRETFNGMTPKLATSPAVQPMPDKTPQDCPTPSGDAYCLRCLHTHDMDAECVGDTHPPDKHQRLDTYDLLTGALTLQVSFSSGLPPQGKTITLPYSEWKRQIEAIIARETEKARDDEFKHWDKQREEVIARTNRESRIDELKHWFPTVFNDGLGINYTVFNEAVRKRIKELEDAN